MKQEVEPAERRLHAACPSEVCLCPVCVIPRRLYEAWQVMDAARKLVRANGCLAAGAAALAGSTMPGCECTYCVLRFSLKAFDAHAKDEPEARALRALRAHRGAPFQLHEGMRAIDARRGGVQVPRVVPDGATLRFRAQRMKAVARPALDFAAADLTSETRVIESTWSWCWQMALGVGARGVPDERGVDYPCEECGALDGNTVQNGWQRCRKCGYPSQ